MRFQFRKGAIADVAAIRTWLNDQRSANAEATFMEDLNAALDRLHDFPELGTKGLRGTRKLVIPRTPYQIVYSLTPGRLIVLHVVHSSRKPGYWLDD